MNERGQVALLKLRQSAPESMRATLLLWQNGRKRTIYKSAEIAGNVNGFNSLAIDDDGAVLLGLDPHTPGSRTQLSLFKKNEGYRARLISLSWNTRALLMVRGRILLDSELVNSTEHIRNVDQSGTLNFAGTGPTDLADGIINFSPGAMNGLGEIAGAVYRSRLPFLLRGDGKIKYFSCPAVLAKIPGLWIWSVSSLSNAGGLIAQGLLSDDTQNFNKPVIVHFKPNKRTSAKFDCSLSDSPSY